MIFSKLYHDNCASVKSALKAEWCQSNNSESQREYSRQISHLIDGELFSSENYVPLVQCMDRYEPLKSVSREEAVSLVGGMWNREEDPFEHQYLSWKALTNKEGQKKSMVVTTGTGSGKTECFMLPLVSDLKDNFESGKIQALFLYPLNALMEDQKGRLQTLLAGTNIKFAVYNGNLPEIDDKKDTILHERIERERATYGNIVATRAEMREDPPQIILTNPTMLEYMLLRNKDQRLFTKKSLKWVVIDEAHTFNGAGAAELAMLLRRVLDAFDLKTTDVRFAMSSATIGNIRSDADRKENVANLRHFIAGITGLPEFDASGCPVIEVIEGQREKTSNESGDPYLERCRSMLYLNDFVKLTDLLPESGETIEEKLKRLDRMSDGPFALNVKLHLFYRVPNRGLFVQLDDRMESSFKVKSAVPIADTKSPYLNLMQCCSCGEFFAAAEGGKESSQFKSITMVQTDLFKEPGSRVSRLLFALSDTPISKDQNFGNIYAEVDGDTYSELQEPTHPGWSLVLNKRGCCPHCGKKLSGGEDDAEQLEFTSETLQNTREFRFDSSVISRIIASKTLKSLSPSGNSSDPHSGQQYISFVDNRQSAAISTLEQNLNQERIWVFSRIFREINALQREQRKASIDPSMLKVLRAMGKSESEITSFLGIGLDYLDWVRIYKLLEPESERMCYQFIDKREGSAEFNTGNNSINNTYKARYINSVMIDLLARRPRSSDSPENLGLFTSYYPKLERIATVPQVFEAFLKANGWNPGESEMLQEWKNLLKIYLDMTVRSNESVFLKFTDNDINLDIMMCQRFGTEKSHRRPVNKPQIPDKKQGGYTTVAYLLANLIQEGAPSLNDVIFDNREQINPILNALWEDLTSVKTSLLTYGEILKNGQWEPDLSKNDDGEYLPSHRLNLTDLAFKPYRKVYLCDTRKRGVKYPVPRPVDTLFFGFSPFIIDGKVVKPIEGPFEWDPALNEDGSPISPSQITQWSKDHRKELWKDGQWENAGGIDFRMEDLYTLPDIFLQAEHTAQVDRIVSKTNQELFKQRKINILACSTTMEMGIDIGSLELVLMASIPPHPTNYKQRAGRSGRGKEGHRSACITLCSSDSIGLRALSDPMTNIINRPMAVPVVDLNSPQVVQRHANAYLFRLSQLFFDNERGNSNNLDQEIIEFFTPFRFKLNPITGKPDHFDILMDDIASGTTSVVFPSQILGESANTKYIHFLNFIDNCDTEDGNHLANLLKGTCFEDDFIGTIMRCRNDMIRLYEELEEHAADIGETYKAEKKRLQESAKKEDREKVKGDEVSSPYGKLLRHKYSELLSLNLLSYLATHRFTPNANMPVNIIEFDLNPGENFLGRKMATNPTYPLNVALSQYAPGRTVVIDNRVTKVRGVLYTGIYRQTNTFKSLCSDGENTVVGESIPEERRITWPINKRTSVTMVEPYAFIPDINEGYTRIRERDFYPKVSAQLIKASQWTFDETPDILFSLRNNMDSGEANILYYNMGDGSGFCFCAECGKAVMEDRASADSEFRGIPEEFNDRIMEKDGSVFQYHLKINRKDRKNGDICRNYEKVHRNVIFGGLIQTDYTEMRIKLAPGCAWLGHNSENYSGLIITLGILFSRTLAEILGKDSQDISFVEMQNGHLCIFDTNPGGSGYSNQLTNLSIFKAVVSGTLTKLKNIKTKDEILDRFSYMYLDSIDVKGAREWLDKVWHSFSSVPKNILSEFPGATVSMFENMITELSSPHDRSKDIIFVGDEWKQWLYEENVIMADAAGISGCWKNRVQAVRMLPGRCKVCIVGNYIELLPVKEMLLRISDWADVYHVENWLPAGLYPLALVNGTLYFTNNPQFALANNLWGRSNIYSVEDISLSAIKLTGINLSLSAEHNLKFIIGNEEALTLQSDKLGALVEEKSIKLFNEFYYHVRNCTDNLYVEYQDEHLKSILGIITVLQFIGHFVKKFKRNFMVAFKVEEYMGPGCGNIEGNLGSDYERDAKLKFLAKHWKETEFSSGEFQMIREAIVNCSRHGTLPHWRELSMTCGHKRLTFYPNGGIINGWSLDRQEARKLRLPGLDVTTDSSIPIIRRDEIMYDVELEDV